MDKEIKSCSQRTRGRTLPHETNRSGAISLNLTAQMVSPPKSSLHNFSLNFDGFYVKMSPCNNRRRLCRPLAIQLRKKTDEESEGQRFYFCFFPPTLLPSWNNLCSLVSLDQAFLSERTQKSEPSFKCVQKRLRQDDEAADLPKWCFRIRADSNSQQQSQKQEQDGATL